MSLLALIFSIIAIDIAIWPRVYYAWNGPRENAWWGVGGALWLIGSATAIFVLVIVHVSILVV